MKEVDLSPNGKMFLTDIGCNKLYGEIVDIDLVGVNNNIIYGLELKLNLNIKVLEQAYKRLPYVNYIYVGVPRKALKNGYHDLNKVYRHFIEYYGVGLVGFEEQKTNLGKTYWYYEIYKHARLNRKPPYKKSIQKHFNELYENRDGGFASGETITPYKLVEQEVLSLAENLTKRHKSFTIDMILEYATRTKKHYHNPKSGVYTILNRYPGKIEKNKNGRVYRWLE